VKLREGRKVPEEADRETRAALADAERLALLTR
jgi:hypothetical protein